MIFSDSDDIEEVEYNQFDVITKSKDLDYAEEVISWLLKAELRKLCTEHSHGRENVSTY